MLGIVGLILAFGIIMVLILKKFNQAMAILAGTLTLGLFSFLSPLNYAQAVSTVLMNLQNYELLLSIALIGSLGNLLKDTGVMTDLTKELKKLLSPRNIIALIPAIMGLLPMAGGALMSAPMIEDEANKLCVSNEFKVFLNIAFRHGWFWVLPLSSGIIFESRFSNIDIPTLIGAQLPYFTILIVLSYFVMVATVKTTISYDNVGIRIPTLASSLGPIAVAIALNLLGVPLYFALLPGFAIVFLLKPHPIRLALKIVFRGIPWNLVTATLAVMLFRAISDETGAFNSIFGMLQGIGVPPLVFAIIFPFLIGFVSALPTIAIPLVFPLVLPMIREMNASAAVVIVYSGIITGYLISPLHMCLVLTNGYYKADLSKTYHYWFPVALTTFLGGVGVTLLISHV